MQEVKIIIPNSNNSGESLSAVIAGTKRNLCELFGGYTAYQAQGGWISNEGDLYEEDVTVLVSAVADVAEAQMVIAIAKNVMTITDQLAVYVSIDGKAEIIE